MTDQINAHLADQRLVCARTSSDRLSDGGSNDTEGKSRRRGAIGRQRAWHLMQDSAVKALLKHHSMRIMTLRSVTPELTATEMHRLRKRVLHCCA